MEKISGKRKLGLRELAAISSMLFGLFFGAGNLIFPVHLGQLAGANVWQAALGFVITGVGIPMLGVAAIGITRSNGLQDLATKVGRRYGFCFTVLLYLTIGPCFAIPRCATVPYEMGLAGFGGLPPRLSLGLFTLAFFAVVLYYALRPQGLMVWVGKVLNPLFLGCLAVLLGFALLRPLCGDLGSLPPDEAFVMQAAAKGFLEGYNTMDAIAGLAFGILIVQAVRGLGVEEPECIAAQTVKAGVFAGAAMAVIYLLIMLMGTLSRGQFALSANGSIALAEIAGWYFGPLGSVFLVVIATLACLKTAIGLIASCSETFHALAPQGLLYERWAALLCGVSFLVANLGLTEIIACAVPVLAFLYPLTITLICLALVGSFFRHSRTVYASVTGVTAVFALLELLHALPADWQAALQVTGLLAWATDKVPLFAFGLGWLLPAALAFVVSAAVWKLRQEKNV